MRYLLIAFLLTGCTLNVPVSQFDAGVAEMCEGGIYQWRGQLVEVVLLDSVDDIYAECGPDAMACSVGGTMWVPSGPKCQKSVAHELNHIADNHWVDAHR